MAIDFPNSPTVGQVFVADNAIAYVWNGTLWTASSSGGMLTSGAGAPTGVSAAKGTLYINTTATTTTTRLYINTDGATTWANFTASA